MFRRGVALVLAVAAVATWLAIMAGRGIGPVEPPAVRRLEVESPLDPAIRSIQSQAGRLRAYLTDAPPLASAVRNPFRFRARPQAEAEVRRARPGAIPTRSAASGRTARPELTLVGLAEDSAPSGSIRTAIISGMGQLFLVKEGEGFGGRFQVVQIGANLVRVLDQKDGTTFSLEVK